MASNRTVYHIAPNSSGKKWLVTQEHGDSREEFGTKAEAVEHAKALAREQEPSQIKVHDADGNMQGPLGEPALWVWQDRRPVPVQPGSIVRSKSGPGARDTRGDGVE